MELAAIFQYELCPVPPSLIDEHGQLCVKELHPPPADITIIDVSQLLCHIVWPFRGDASTIVESMKTKLSKVPGEKVLVFDKYHEVSAKDHERMRRAGLRSISYDLTINTPLPSREAIMKNKHHELQPSKVLSTFDFGEDVTVESSSSGEFKHDEADITMISLFLEAAKSDTAVIRILSDDTDVFVLLVYWVYTNNIQVKVWCGI